MADTLDRLFASTMKRARDALELALFLPESEEQLQQESHQPVQDQLQVEQVEPQVRVQLQPQPQKAQVQIQPQPQKAQVQNQPQPQKAQVQIQPQKTYAMPSASTQGKSKATVTPQGKPGAFSMETQTTPQGKPEAASIATQMTPQGKPEAASMETDAQTTRLADEMASFTQQYMAQSFNELEDTRATVSALQQELQLQTSQVARLSEQVHIQQTAIQVLGAENGALKTAATASAAELAQLQAIHAVQQAECEARVNEARQRAATNEQLVQERDETIARLQRELRDCQADIEMLDAQHQQQESVATIDTSGFVIRMQQEQLEILQQANSTLQTGIADVRRKAEQTVSELTTRVGEMENELVEQTSRFDELQDTLTAAKQQFEAVEGALTKQLVSLQGEMEYAVERVLELEQELEHRAVDATQFQDTIDKMAGGVQRLENQNASLKQSLVRLHRTVEGMAKDIKKITDQHKSELEQCNAALAKVETELDISRRKHGDVHRRLLQYRLDFMRRLEVTEETLGQKISTLKATVDANATQMAQDSANAVIMARRLYDMQQDIGLKQSNIDILNKRILEYQQHREGTTKMFREWINNLLEERSERNEYEREQFMARDKLMRQLAEANTLLTTSKAQLAECEAKAQFVNEATATLDTIDRDIQQLVANHASELTAYKEQLDFYKELLAQHNNEGNNQQPVADHQARLAELRENSEAACKAQLADCEAKGQHVLAESAARMQDLVAEHKDVLNNLQRQHAEQLQQLDKQRKSADTDVEYLGKIDTAKNDLIESLRTELEQERSRNEQDRKSLIESNQRFAASLTATVDTAQKRYAEQLTVCAQELIQAKTHVIELANSMARLANLLQTENNITSITRQTISIVSDVQVLASHLAEEKQRNAQLTTQLADTTRILASKTDDACTGLRQTLAAIRNAVDADSKDDAALVEHIKDIAQARQAAVREVATLQTKMQQAADVVQLRETCAALAAEKRAFALSLHVDEKDVYSTLNALLASRNDNQADVDRLAVDIGQLKLQLTSAERARQMAEDEVVAVSAMWETANAGFLKNAATLATIRAVVGVEQEDDVSEHIRQFVEEQKDIASTLGVRVDKIADTLQTLLQSTQALEAENRRLLDAVDEKEQQLQATLQAKHEPSTSVAVVAQQHAENQELQAALGVLQQTNAELHNKLDHATKTINQLRQQVDDLTDDLAAQTDEFEQSLKKRLHEYNVATEDLQRQIAEQQSIFEKELAHIASLVGARTDVNDIETKITEIGVACQAQAEELARLQAA